MKILTSHKPGLAIFVTIFLALVLSLIFFSTQASFAQTTKNKEKKPLTGKNLTEKKEAKESPEKKDPTGKKDPTDKKELADKTLHVISDKMIAEKGGSMVEFIGNAKATREDSIVFADSIKIYFNNSETKTKNQSSVKEIISSGNVRYTSGKNKAFADKAVYTLADEILVLTGKSPKLLTGKSHVTGKKITLFRTEDRVLVESDDKTRVQAIFNPEDQKKGADQ